MSVAVASGCSDGAGDRQSDADAAVSEDADTLIPADLTDATDIVPSDSMDATDSTVETTDTLVDVTDATSSTPYVPPNGDLPWQTLDPTTAGFSEEGLADLRTVVEENNSSSFMLLIGGRVVVEWYFKGTNASTQLEVASVQKSITSTLVGLARKKGLLELDDRVSDYLSVGWSAATEAQEGLITLRHLMTHSSGLSPTTLRRVAAPGTVFDYNTNAYQKLRLVLEAVSDLDINTLSRTWLFDAIGIGGEWFDRGTNDPTGAATWGLRLSARDMARFGLFAQRLGVWGDTAITSPTWFAEAWTPSGIKPDYGLLWWLQGRGSLQGKAPLDLVSALGARDQKIYVVPSLSAVVTRQGLAAGTASEAESNFDLVLLNAIANARIAN